MAHVAVVSGFDQRLQLRHIVRIRKVDDVDVDVVSLQTLAQFLASSDILLDWVANENDDSLPLILVLAVLQRQLGNLDRCEEVGPSI